MKILARTMKSRCLLIAVLAIAALIMASPLDDLLIILLANNAAFTILLLMALVALTLLYLGRRRQV